MRRGWRVPSALTVLALAGCSAGADVTWSVPLELDGAFAQTQTLRFADLGDVVVVPSGQAINGYSTDGNKLWNVTLGEDVSTCEAAGPHAMCVTRSPVFVSKDGTVQARPDLAFEGQSGDKFYYSRLDEDALVLVAEDASTPFEQIGSSDTVIARYENRTSYLPDGTRVERGEVYPEPLQTLVDEGVIARNSIWLNPPGIANVASPLTDGYVVVEPGQVTVSSVEPTKLTVLDAEGNETDRYTVTPALHIAVQPEWTQETIGEIALAANALSTSHALVFKDGKVVGFDQKLTDSVAPAFANVEALIMADGTNLKLDPIEPEYLGLWLLDYPYVSVTGQNFAATFDVTSGRRVVDGKRCQLTGDTYCFSPTTLEKVRLPE